MSSMKSVDSVPVLGTYPLGSLRVNDPEDVSMSPATPLTAPDLSSSMHLENLKSGDVVMFDDLPDLFTIGCDTISFTASQKFLGFRDIPEGAHLIWVSPDESSAARTGFWIFTSGKADTDQGQVYVKEWNKFNEVLDDPASQAEGRIQKERLEQIFSGLLPYQHRASTTGFAGANRPSSDPLPSFISNTTIWSWLTSAINPQLLDRITGRTQTTWPVSTSDHAEGEQDVAGEALKYLESSNHLKFTFPIGKLLIDPNAEGIERTRQALDPTNWIVAKTHSFSDEEQGFVLLGELQFAFLTGMHLGNFACLEQWCFYVSKVIFRAYRLAVEKPRLARKLIQAFHTQLVYNERYLEGDVLETIPGNTKQLQKVLTTYKARLDEMLLALGEQCTAEQKAVGEAFSSLEEWLWKLGWDLRGEYVRSGPVMLEDGEIVEAELSDFEEEDERGEFAAVVVELDADGRPTDFVSWDA